jgi:hypothetical protein
VRLRVFRPVSPPGTTSPYISMRSTILAVVLAAASAFAATQQVSYDPVYDNKTQSLATVECSDGSHGLLTKGYTTFGRQALSPPPKVPS